MEKRLDLAPGYSISRVINGCWQLSEGHTLRGGLDFKDVMRAFHMLADQGLTTFDCADIYTGVEEFLGEFVKELKGSSGVSPDDIQIHTKYVPDIDALSRVDFQYTENIIDRSLKRLNRDALDLVQFHWWDYAVPGAVEAAGHMKKLKDKGKIRHIGATNFDAEHLAEIVDAGVPVVSVQAQYSVFDRRPEKRLLDYCKANNIAVLCYGTLAGGYLAERWRGSAMAKPETRSQVKYLQVIEDTLGWKGYQGLLELLGNIAQKHAVSIANAATRFILDQPGMRSAAIVGVRSSRHVASNAKALSFELSAADIAEIRQYLDNYAVLDGEPFELERTIGSKYREIMKMNLSEE